MPSAPSAPKRAQRLAREVVLAIPARGVGRELALRERAHRVADQRLLLGQAHRPAIGRDGHVRTLVHRA